MLISIFSHDAADIALIKRSLPGYDCQVAVPGSNEWKRLGTETLPQLLILDLDLDGAAAQLLADLRTRARDLPLLLLATNEATVLTSGANDTGHALCELEFKPLRRHAVAARVKLLLQRAYPDHQAQQWQQFGDFRFESPAGLVHHGADTVLLTQKEFALATLLFSHLGRPLSRAYLQESVWGPEPEDELPTRTIDTHISRVRNKLGLKPANGFRLSTVYGYGYQLERMDRDSQAPTQ